MTQTVRGAMLLSTEERTRRASAGLRRKHPLRDIGDGPWKVLSYCDAQLHNSLRAARGQRVPGGERCICPQARALLAEHAARQAEVRKARRMGLPVSDLRKTPRPRRGHAARQEKMQTISAYFTNIADGAEMPDLTGAACRTPLALVLFDAAHEGRLIGEAKNVCYPCPVRTACLAWVTGAEKPAGAWGGVYGGLSVTDRKKRKEFTR